MELKVGVGSTFPKIDETFEVVSGKPTELSVNLGQITIFTFGSMEMPSAKTLSTGTGTCSPKTTMLGARDSEWSI